MHNLAEAPKCSDLSSTVSLAGGIIVRVWLCCGAAIEIQSLSNPGFPAVTLASLGQHGVEAGSCVLSVQNLLNRCKQKSTDTGYAGVSFPAVFTLCWSSMMGRLRFIQKVSRVVAKVLYDDESELWRLWLPSPV